MKIPLWQPSLSSVNRSSMMEYWRYIESRFNQNFNSYQELHQWSVENPQDFWPSLLSFFDVIFEGDLLPTFQDFGFFPYPWFPNIKLNFAENLLRFRHSSQTALSFEHESSAFQKITYRELFENSSRLEQHLKKFINQGDVVAAYMPNIPETVISMLATSSLGGVFTSTSPDFGSKGVIDRFGQTFPKVLIASLGYTYNGKYFDQSEKILEVISNIPSIKEVIIVDFLNKNTTSSLGTYWNTIETLPVKEMTFKKVPFNSTLYIMYSSGTTGKPKCIEHTVGGTLTQHVKELGLHTNLKESEKIFFFTTCGWMMWNWLVSSLYFKSEIILYEGSPSFPSFNHFMDLINKNEINYFGTSPKFLSALENSDFKSNSYPTLKTLLSTGSPLNPEQYDFILQRIKSNLQISSICGGTDIVSCFMLGNPILPVYRGEIQCLGLGMDVACFNNNGNRLIEQEGELVCMHPFISQPKGFWGDVNYKKFEETYFSKFKDIWYHGDFITITESGGVKVFGRSDATLNPGGVRIGTSEIYQQIEKIHSIEDSICIGQNFLGDVRILLFVKTIKNVNLDDKLLLEIKNKIRSNTSPRHVPSLIFQVTEIPYTRSGKKMELLVSRIFNNKEINNLEAISNPSCLEEYKNIISSLIE